MPPDPASSRTPIAAMLTADAELDARAYRAPTLHRQLDQPANAVDVETDERILGVDALVDVGAEEAAGVVTAHAERRLR